MTLSDYQIKVIQVSFSLLRDDLHDCLRLFCKKLSELDSESQLHEDIRLQRSRLAMPLPEIVANLHQPEIVRLELLTFQRLCSYYGVSFRNGQAVSDALVWMLERKLGSVFTLEIKSSWIELFQILKTEWGSLLEPARMG